MLSALEQKPQPSKSVVIVMGPFMAQAVRHRFQRRAAVLADVQMITFNANMEILMDRADGIVAMGGYNTFCEILSFNKRALLIPRSTPRMEQTLRAHRAASLGLVSMLNGDGDRSPDAMAKALIHLERQSVPFDHGADQFLDGLEVICNRVKTLIAPSEEAHQGTG